ncbi:MAG: hypothetical protein KF713_05940 [Turneriella sp.]|nr:hypothetical protein [Turneriella sp.]
MRREREQILINDFDLVHRGLLEGEEFDMNIAEMNRDESEALDVHFMRLIGMFADNGFEGMLTGGEKTWRNEFKRIARGEYPLEQLPAHVRALAAQLYYR